MQNSSKQASIDRFGKTAQSYVSSPTHQKGYDLDRLLELADPQPDWQMLDTATGGGHTALKFSPFVKQAVASDITPQMLEAASAHIRGKGITNVSFEHADAEDLPFENGRFDLVTCRIAPHHFPNVQQFVLESARVLKPGGLFLLQDQTVPDDAVHAGYVNAFEKLRDPSHNKACSPADWAQWFSASGFSIQHTEVFAKRHDLLYWAGVQNCTPSTIESLMALLKAAPEPVRVWLDPQELDGEKPSFVNRHIIMVGKKAE